MHPPSIFRCQSKIGERAAETAPSVIYVFKRRGLAVSRIKHLNGVYSTKANLETNMSEAAAGRSDLPALGGGYAQRSGGGKIRSAAISSTSRAHVTKHLSKSDIQIVEKTFKDPTWNKFRTDGLQYQRGGTFHRASDGVITVAAAQTAGVGGEVKPNRFPYTDMVSLGLRHLFTEYETAFVGDGTYLVSYVDRVVRRNTSARARWHCDGAINGQYFALYYGPGPKGPEHKVPVTAIAEVENPRSYSRLATPPPGGEFC